MKFLHTADWHIGKELGAYSLLAQQTAAFNEIMQIARDEKVDAILLAGDLYDRAIPPTTAVNALEGMLKALNLTSELPIFAVSGNHDGPARLGAGKEWREANQFYLRTELAEAFEPIEFGNTQIFMLPFLDPLDARIYYEIENDSGEVRTINDVMTRVVTDMKNEFTPGMQHVLVSHYYVTGSRNEDYTLTSETTSSVGGLKGIDVNVFNDFDYVALGHLHLKQASPSENVQYSGSPIKFNTKEAQSEKGVFIVDIDDTGVNSKWMPLHPDKDLILLTESFETLIDADFYQQYERNGANLFSIQLTDQPQVSDLRKQLVDIYGKIAEIQFPKIQMEMNDVAKRLKAQEEVSNQTLIQEFYEEVMHDKLNQNQMEIIEQTLIGLNREVTD